MREIKFRAWSKEFGMSPATTLANMLQVVARKDSHDYPDELMTLMQYTGLKDKNGVEIYEGDIVQPERSWLTGENYKGSRLVAFADAMFIMGRFDKTGILRDGDRLLGIHVTDQCRVIGNIYENRELLEPEGGR